MGVESPGVGVGVGVETLRVGVGVGVETPVGDVSKSGSGS